MLLHRADERPRLGFDDLSKLIGSDSGKGVKANKNSITFDPDLMWGLPIHGHVMRAMTTSAGLLLTFGPDQSGGNAGSNAGASARQ